MGRSVIDHHIKLRPQRTTLLVYKWTTDAPLRDRLTILPCPWHWLKRGNTAPGFCKHKEALTWLFNLLHVLCEKSQAEDLFYFIDCAGSPLLHRLFSSCSEPGAALYNGSLWACRCGWWPLCRAWNPGCLGLSSFKLWNTDSVWQTGLVAPWHGGSSQTRAQTHVSCIGRQILYHWATREALQTYF